MKSESIIVDPCHINAGHKSGLILKEETVKSIFNEIKRNISDSNFEKADQLRLQIFAIDNRAVNEIFESGRLIENAKRESDLQEELLLETGNKNNALYNEKEPFIPGVYPEPISNKPQHQINNFLSIQRAEHYEYLRIHAEKNGHSGRKVAFMAHWFQFFNKLEPEYLNCLMESVTPLTCTTDKYVITNGRQSNRLYFINRGSAVVTYNNTSKEKKYLSDGDIIGDISFFSRTKSPVTAVAEKGSEIYFLEYNDLMELKSIFPDIDEALYSLCVSHISRRRPDEEFIVPRFHERFNAEGVVSVQIINNYEKYEPFRGSLIDISYGGFSFQIETHNTGMIQNLKNKKIKAAIDIQSNETPWLDLLWGGLVVDVKQSSSILYSVHVKGHEKNQNLHGLINHLK